MAHKVWNGWKINPDDIEIVRKRNGIPKRIGGGATGQVYLGQMKQCDGYGEIIPGEFTEVSVKQFSVPRSEEPEQLTKFMREVFLQKEADHTNIIRTYHRDMSQRMFCCALWTGKLMDRLKYAISVLLGRHSKQTWRHLRSERLRDLLERWHICHQKSSAARLDKLLSRLAMYGASVC